MRVFVAGATGAIGRRLLPALTERGHEVVGSTTSTQRFDEVRALGAVPVAMDGLDASSVGAAVAKAEPEVIVHQMTALAGFASLRRFDHGFALTNLLRTRGLDHLLAAADAVGARRIVAQSYTGCPNERVGSWVKAEDDPLDPTPPARQRRSREAAAAGAGVGRPFRHRRGGRLDDDADSWVGQREGEAGSRLGACLEELARRFRRDLMRCCRFACAMFVS